MFGGLLIAILVLVGLVFMLAASQCRRLHEEKVAMDRRLRALSARSAESE